MVKKAIKLYKKQLDVILMDIQMPKKMALKLLIRKLGRSGVTPIIALTAGILIEEEKCLKAE
jgi:CheY-like chemotaxis protein